MTPSTTIQNVPHKFEYDGHGVRLIYQHVLEELYRTFYTDFLETSRRRMRSENDTALPFLYNHFAIKYFNATSSKSLKEQSFTGNFRGKRTETRKDVRDMLSQKYIMWSYNDDAPSEGTKKELDEVEDSINILVDLMEEEFPFPCELENVLPNETIIPRNRREWYDLFDKIILPREHPDYSFLSPIPHVVFTVIASALVGFLLGKYFSRK